MAQFGSVLIDVNPILVISTNLVHELLSGKDWKISEKYKVVELRYKKMIVLNKVVLTGGVMNTISQRIGANYGNYVRKQAPSCRRVQNYLQAQAILEMICFAINLRRKKPV